MLCVSVCTFQSAGYPSISAAHVALSTVRLWLEEEPYTEQVGFICERLSFCVDGGGLSGRLAHRSDLTNAKHGAPLHGVLIETPVIRGMLCWPCIILCDRHSVYMSDQSFTLPASYCDVVVMYSRRYSIILVDMKYGFRFDHTCRLLLCVL